MYCAEGQRSPTSAAWCSPQEAQLNHQLGLDLEPGLSVDQQAVHVEQHPASCPRPLG
jgi:hypothetical protein